MLLTYVLIDFHLEFQAFGEVDPVHPFRPSLFETIFIKYFMELAFCPIDVLIWGVDDEVVIFGEDGDDDRFLEIRSPGELFYKVKKLGLIDSISLSETGDINDAVKTDF